MYVTKRRSELGEAKWAEYQRERKRAKSRKYMKKVGSVRATQSRRNKKIALIEYKGGKCEQCGYDKPIPSVYHFHHIDPAKKDFAIASTTKSIQTLKAEVDKCKLLCANCHFEVHFEIEQQKYRNKLEQLDIQSVKNTMIGKLLDNIDYQI